MRQVQSQVMQKPKQGLDLGSIFSTLGFVLSQGNPITAAIAGAAGSMLSGNAQGAINSAAQGATQGLAPKANSQQQQPQTPMPVDFLSLLAQNPMAQYMFPMFPGR